MEIFYYIIIFIIGACLGSFYMSAIKNICKNQNIFSLHTYCSNCGQKLAIFEIIPIISYIFLGGKCKHCNKKIDTHYILLELITGVLFVLTTYILNITITNFNISKFISYIFIILYFSYIIIASGLDKRNHNMSPSLLAFGIIISLAYMVYECIINITNIYVNIINLCLIVILLLLNILITKKRAYGSYTIDLLTTLMIMLIFTQEIVSLITIIATILAVLLYTLTYKIKMRLKKNKTKCTLNIRKVYIMGWLNIFTFLALVNISMNINI